MKKVFLFLSIILMSVSASASRPDIIPLPRPDKTGGKALMKTLNERHSEREFSADTISDDDLSDLLWAANGVNRVDGKRTAPSAMNRQEIDIYVITGEGAYFYNPQAHQLELISRGDYRQAVAGRQEFASKAPVSIVLVGNLDRFGSDDATARTMVAVDAGIVCQNINLYCTSAGLVTVPRVTMDSVKLSEVLMLGDKQLLLLNNPVGHPVKR